jgi:hypothetical protein
MRQDEKMTNKWWYRLIQVAFVVFIIFLLGSTTAATIEVWPDLNVRSSRYHLECENGETRGDFDGSDLNYFGTDFDTFYSSGKTAEKFAKIVCSRAGITAEEVTAEFIDDNIPAEKNYRIATIKKEYDGEWWHPPVVALGGLIFTTILSLLIRAIFQYVAFHKPFWRTLFLRRQTNYQGSEDVLTSL